MLKEEARQMNNWKENSNELPLKLAEFGYVYLYQIGEGGFGNVHLIFSLTYNQYFVLKQDKTLTADTISTEFDLLKQVFHPNIVNIYSKITIDSINCLILEHCPNGTIEDLINSSGPIHQSKLYNYCFQILSAVECIHHNNICHRDIKPSNILLDSHDRPKLTDFGLSRQLCSNTIATSKSSFKSTMCGTLMFLPPEALYEDHGYDPFSRDIYSLGVTFYCMYKGKFPFEATNKRVLKQLILNGFNSFPITIDQSLEEMICNMMRINPSERPHISQLMNNSIFNNIKTKGQNSFSRGAIKPQLINQSHKIMNWTSLQKMK
jgi:serine/threonine protein kinase